MSDRYKEIAKGSQSGPLKEQIRKAEQFAVEVGEDVIDVLAGMLGVAKKEAVKLYKNATQEDTKAHSMTEFRESDRQTGSNNRSTFASDPSDNETWATQDSNAPRPNNEGELAGEGRPVGGKRGARGPSRTEQMETFAKGSGDNVAGRERQDSQEGGPVFEDAIPVSESESTEELKNFQQALIDADPSLKKILGSPDGKMSDRTRQAIVEWKRRHGRQYGIMPGADIDQKTLNVITGSSVGGKK